MRTALSLLSLLRPRTLRDALAMLRDEGPLMPLAGCTDLYVGLQFGTLPDRRFIDLWRLRELRGIGDERGTLRIGAMTTYTDLIQSPLVRRRIPMLVASAREVGGKQIQNRGTLGGNIANGSPIGDTPPACRQKRTTGAMPNSRIRRRNPSAFDRAPRAAWRSPAIRSPWRQAALGLLSPLVPIWLTQVGCRPKPSDGQEFCRGASIQVELLPRHRRDGLSDTQR